MRPREGDEWRDAGCPPVYENKDDNVEGDGPDKEKDEVDYGGTSEELDEGNDAEA